MAQAVQPTQIKEHMDVISSDGTKIGSVDHMDGTNQIKLTKHDAPDGKHHMIPLAWVDHVTSTFISTRRRTTRKAQWKAA